MKRFHTHIAVEDIEKNIDFYSKLFGQPPSKRKDDYAKWLLDDPRINFSISARGHAVGVNHFGFQVDSAEELAEFERQAEAASEEGLLDQGQTSCCYSVSEKHWTIDPQGLAWEHFHSLSDAPDFGEGAENRDGACCIPVHSSNQDSPAVKAACCIPNNSPGKEGACCD